MNFARAVPALLNVRRRIAFAVGFGGDTLSKLDPRPPLFESNLKADFLLVMQG